MITSNTATQTNHPSSSKTKDKAGKASEGDKDKLTASHPFLKFPVRDLNDRIHTRVVEVTTRTSLKDVILTLAREDISSVPVFDDKEGQYLGFIEIKDIVKLLADASAISTSDVYDVAEINRRMSSFLQSVLVEDSGHDGLVTKIAKEKGLQYVKMAASILDVILLMKQGASRVPVLGTDGKIVQIISQSDVIYYLARHTHALDSSVLSKSVLDLNLGVKKVVAVESRQHACHAILFMAKHNLSAVPVVEDNRRRDLENDGSYSLVDAINERDILCAASAFIRDDFNLKESGGLYTFFAMPSLEFLHAVRATTKSRRMQHFFATTVTLQANEKLWYVLHKLALTKLHRLYVVEYVDYILEHPDAGHIRGVISLIDIIRLLF